MCWEPHNSYVLSYYANYIFSPITFTYYIIMSLVCGVHHEPYAMSLMKVINLMQVDSISFIFLQRLFLEQH